MEAKLLSPNVLGINGKSIEFKQRIKEFVEVGNRIIVLLKVSDFEKGDELVGRNIVAVNEQGEIDWRIEYHGFKVRPPTNNAPQAFFGLWIDEDDGSLRAGIPVADFVVDPETGTFQKVELNRW